MKESPADKLQYIVMSFQANDKEPPTIRYLAKRMRMSQRAVLDLCEDKGLNVNIGLGCHNGGCGGIYQIGNYTVEDLSYHKKS